MKVNTYKSVNEAFMKVLNYIQSEGRIVRARGLETKEVVNCVFKIENPRNRLITIPERKWSNTLAVGELCWHLTGSDKVKFISYYAKNWASFSKNGTNIEGSCYGKQIFLRGNNEKLSQWDSLLNLLREDPETRRAVLVMNYPEHEKNIDKDYPCITHIQFFIRENELHCVNNMRSNDIIWGLCYDVYFVTMLQEILSLRLGVQIGNYFHNSGSMHLYERFYSLSDRLSNGKFKYDDGEMRPMDNVGEIKNFLICEDFLRHGDKRAIAIYEGLPGYWKDLARPLILKSLKEYKAIFSSSDFVGMSSLPT